MKELMPIQPTEHKPRISPHQLDLDPNLCQHLYSSSFTGCYISLFKICNVNMSSAGGYLVDDVRGSVHSVGREPKSLVLPGFSELLRFSIPYSHWCSLFWRWIQLILWLLYFHIWCLFASSTIAEQRKHTMERRWCIKSRQVCWVRNFLYSSSTLVLAKYELRRLVITCVAGLWC